VSSLAAQRCFHHAEREAAARCTGCGRFFCRECVSDHDDRAICATCLRRLSEQPLAGPGRHALISGGVLGLLGFLAAWFFFYLVGEALLNLPTDFHEGTIWRSNWRDLE
jgi:hypothetical protein